jgi:mono/diheme cytochrome c family protein
MEIGTTSRSGALAAFALLVCAIAFSGFDARGADEASQTRVQRGAYLVNGILACGNCHTPRDEKGQPVEVRKLSGGLSFTTPAFVATAPNITPDRETGIGTWSDAEIKRALTQGIRPSHGMLAGVALAAIMPVNFYKALLPEDLDAIVAYLRSVKPVHNAVVDPVYRAPVHREPYPDAEAGFTQAALHVPAKNGAYLVTIGHCMECHAAWAKGVSDYKNGLGQGGRVFPPTLVHGLGPNWHGSTAANISSHSEKGLGRWSDDEIKHAITQGISRDGRKLQPPMPFAWYRSLSRNDLNAIVAYLRTLPPKE